MGGSACGVPLTRLRGRNDTAALQVRIPGSRLLGVELVVEALLCKQL